MYSASEFSTSFIILYYKIHKLILNTYIILLQELLLNKIHILHSDTSFIF